MGKRIRRIVKILTCNSEENSPSKEQHETNCESAKNAQTDECNEPTKAVDPVRGSIAETMRFAEEMYDRIQSSIDALREKLEKHNEELTEVILSHCVAKREAVSTHVRGLMKPWSCDDWDNFEGVRITLRDTPNEDKEFGEARPREEIVTHQAENKMESQGSEKNEHSTEDCAQPRSLQDMSKRKLVTMVYQKLLHDRKIARTEDPQHPGIPGYGDTVTTSDDCDPEKPVYTEPEFVFGAHARIYDMLSRNNNHPGNDEDLTTDQPVTINFHERSASQDSQGSSSSAGPVQKTTARKGKEYCLFPIGSITTSNPSCKWRDIVNIIPVGVRLHRNIDVKKYDRYEKPTTTISQGLLTSCYVKAKAYAIRRIRPPIVCMEPLMEQNASTRIFQETHAKFVCVNLLMALRFLHENVIAHGSLSPKKVILNEKGYPCLTGFDTIEVFHDRPSRPRGRIDVEYSSSEQIYQDCVSDVTDVYSLGVLTYHMIYGRPPHRGKTPADTRRNALNKNFEPQFRPEPISKEGRKFIMKCIRKYEDRRFKLRHMKSDLFDSVSWFSGLNEDKLYKQTVPSPLQNIVAREMTHPNQL